MERRRLLRLSGGIGSAFLAGCTGALEDDDGGLSIQDSDGDGVIDSEDYAPNDPEVQEKSDLQSKTTATKKASAEGTATTTTPTTTTTTTTTTTATTTTTTAKPDPNELRADSDFFEGDSYVASYTSEENRRRRSDRPESRRRGPLELRRGDRDDGVPARFGRDPERKSVGAERGL